MSFFISCSGTNTHNKSTTYEKEFYSVLNDLIRMKLIHAAVILDETTLVTKIMWTQVVANRNVNVPTDGSNLAIQDTYGLRSQSILNSAEISYLYTAIDSMKIMRIDSAKVVVPTIPARELQRIFSGSNRKDGYEVMKQRYGTSCNIKVSTPLFNSDFTKAVLWVDYQCGWKHGQGYVFVLEKRRGMWWLIEDIGTWIS